MTARSAVVFTISALLAAAALYFVLREPAKPAPEARREPVVGTTFARSAAALTADDVLPMTCAQAWDAAGKRYPEMLRIVVTLAKVSLANRNLDFPDTREAGLDAGRGIAKDCKADPQSLLFATVDKHVRRVAEASGD